MSLPPITINQLDPAGPIDFDNDLLIIRQNLNDKKATPSQVSKMRLNTLPTLPSPVTPSDLFLVSRDIGAGVYENYSTSSNNIGFYSGTVMWFYTNSSAAIPGWTPLAGVADRILGVKGGSTYTTGGTSSGTWTQPGWALTVEQMPAHIHTTRMSDKPAGSKYNNKEGTMSYDSASNWANVPSKTTGGPGSTPEGSAAALGSAAEHFHGSDWRPLAAVGMLFTKN